MSGKVIERMTEVAMTGQCNTDGRQEIQEFGYDMRGLWQVALVFPCAAAYLLWRRGDFTRPDVIVVMLVGAYLLAQRALPLCKVVVTPSDIQVKFLFPFRRGGLFRHEEIASYAEMILPWGKKRAFAGFLQPKEGKGIMLTGVRDFEGLNALLLGAYPRPGP